MIDIPTNLPKEILDKYNLVNNSFITKDNGEKASELKVIIGDDKQDDFFPQAKIDKWSGETNFSVRLKHTEKRIRIETDGDKIKWKGRKVEAHFYDVPKTKDLPKAFELEILLLEKPETNKVEFTTQSKGLKFYYQPSLKEEHKIGERGAVEIIDTDVKDKDGKVIAHRPENVVGSYAVYHESKAGDYSQMGLKNYRAGKAFHIYRPKIIDNAGKEVWGKLNITDNLLTVEIPQEFLDNAVYPVRHAAGLEFGYTTKGQSSFHTGSSSWIHGSLFTGVSGTGVSISAYIEVDLDTHRQCKYNIYLHSNLNPLENGETVENDETTGGTASGDTWLTLNFVSAPTLTATDYILALFSRYDDDNYFYYDAGDTDQGHNQYLTYGDWPNPLNPSHSTNKYSIYCTYTAGGAGNLKSLNGVAFADIKSINGIAKASVKSVNGISLT